jgi:hypothetical protein
MTTKLTLKLNKRTIERAKKYARAKRTNLSLLVERFFKSLPEEKAKSKGNSKTKSEIELSPIVKELSGIIELPEDFDPKSEYTKYLIEKYT